MKLKPSHDQRQQDKTDRDNKEREKAVDQEDKAKDNDDDEESASQSQIAFDSSDGSAAASPAPPSRGNSILAFATRADCEAFCVRCRADGVKKPALPPIPADGKLPPSAAVKQQDADKDKDIESEKRPKPPRPLKTQGTGVSDTGLNNQTPRGPDDEHSELRRADTGMTSVA